MNIDTFCYLRSASRLDATSKVDIDRNNTIVSRPNGPSFKFTEVFKDRNGTGKLLLECLRPLINRAINGFNSSLLLLGEDLSDDTLLLTDGGSGQMGLFASAMGELFSLLQSDERFRSSYKVRLRMFEVHEDVLLDLVTPTNSSRLSIDSVTFTEEQGPDIKGLSEMELVSAAQSLLLFRESWKRRTAVGTKDRNQQASIIVQIRLLLKNVEEPNRDTVSQLSFVCLPGEEGKGMLAVKKVFEDFGKSGTNYGTYSYSLQTTVLEEELGGNCVTSVLLCISSDPSPDTLEAQLNILTLMAATRTSPIENTAAARRLLNILRLQRNELLQMLFGRSSSGPRNATEIFDTLKLTQRENANLRDKLETLQLRVEKLHGRYNHAVMDRSNLSEDFIHSEEEKLKASKRIMELEIESNKSKETLENLRFELTNKILHLEEKLAHKEMEKTFFVEDAKAFKTVNGENIKLKSMYQSLQKAYEDLKTETGLIISKNKELNLEFLNMLKVKRKVLKNEVEVDSIIPMSEILQVGQDNRDQLRLSQDRKPLSGIIRQEERSFKIRLGKLQDELLRTRQTSHDRLQQVSKVTLELIMLKDENKKLITRIKDLTKSLGAATQDYQQRIKKYVVNMSNLLESGPDDYRRYKDETIKLLRKYESSHNVVENNLKNLLKDCKQQMDSLRIWSERIVYEYDKLRQQVLSEHPELTNIGPDPLDIVDDYNLPINYLKVVTDNRTKKKSEAADIMELKQQIKEFSNNNQSALEIERAQLIARNAELEEELITSQNYIDIYIKKKAMKVKR